MKFFTAATEEIRSIAEKMAEEYSDPGNMDSINGFIAGFEARDSMESQQKTQIAKLETDVERLKMLLESFFITEKLKVYERHYDKNTARRMARDDWQWYCLEHNFKLL